MPRDEWLQARSQRLRHEPTEPEKRLWRNLSNRQLEGYKSRHQTRRSPFIADFFCPQKALIVEVDSETHLAAADARRDAALAEQGFTTIRFTNHEVMTNMDGVLITILNTLKELPDRWDRSCSGPDYRPLPNPTPEGEGHFYFSGEMRWPILLRGRWTVSMRRRRGRWRWCRTT
jgi:very-short-patch-repair endonuclease